MTMPIVSVETASAAAMVAGSMKVARSVRVRIVSELSGVAAESARNTASNIPRSAS